MHYSCVVGAVVDYSQEYKGNVSFIVNNTWNAQGANNLTFDLKNMTIMNNGQYVPKKVQVDIKAKYVCDFDQVIAAGDKLCSTASEMTTAVSNYATKVTSDLSYAKVYFTSLDDDKEKVANALNKASSFIRTMLCDRINIRKMPEIHFVFDESIDYGKKIDDIIERIHNEG